MYSGSQNRVASAIDDQYINLSDQRKRLQINPNVYRRCCNHPNHLYQQVRFADYYVKVDYMLGNQCCESRNNTGGCVYSEQKHIWIDPTSTGSQYSSLICWHFVWTVGLNGKWSAEMQVNPTIFSLPSYPKCSLICWFLSLDGAHEVLIHLQVTLEHRHSLIFRSTAWYCFVV